MKCARCGQLIEDGEFYHQSHKVEDHLIKRRVRARLPVPNSIQRD